ncbi:MAG: hypothetical protein JWR85_984, partial [Marmoricola sp.]|nr:hypothetical protein [Marmoricola sp.]
TASEFHGGRVEIRTDEGKVISAKVAEDLVPRLGDFFSKRVQAETIETIARSTATGLEKSSYVVLGLSSLPAQEEEPPNDG